MKRREFITLIGGTAAAWPLAARAQQRERVRRIGVLSGFTENDPEGQARLKTFAKGLRELGWIEGGNVRIDYRWGSADVDQTGAAAKELVKLQCDVLVASSSTPAVAALLAETRTIPVVFAMISDPVGSRFVESLAHPGGNATGFINIEGSMGGKWLELIKEVSPRVTQVALIFNPDIAPHAKYYIGPFEAAAKAHSVEPVAAPVRTISDIENIVTTRAGPEFGLVVIPDIFTTVNRKRIIELTKQYRVPALYPYRFMAHDGGLMSYGIDPLDLFTKAASYVNRILRGERPSELPVQLPTKFELAINLKTAGVLGLTIPPTLLAIADEVID